MEQERATYSSIRAWNIPRTEELGGLQSMGWQSQTPLSNFSLCQAPSRKVTPLFTLSRLHAEGGSSGDSQGRAGQGRGTCPRSCSGGHRGLGPQRPVRSGAWRARPQGLWSLRVPFSLRPVFESCRTASPAPCHTVGLVPSMLGVFNLGILG